MKYIVIRAKDDEVKQDILRRLSGGRHLEWTEVPDPRECAENQISLIMADGVSFTLSCNPNQSTTNDNSSSRVAADDVPSTSSGLRDHQSNPPVRTDLNGYDTQQYPYSQTLDHGYRRYTNYQSYPLAINESNGYYVYQYDYSQSSAHSYVGYSMKDLGIENGNDTLSMEPSTSTAPKRPMDDKDSKKNEDYTYQAKKPRNELEKDSSVDVRCQVCKHMYSSKNRDFYYAQKHAATHPKEKFKCPVVGCDFTDCWMYNVEKHFRKDHKDHKDFQQLEKKLELTPEEWEEWKQHVNKCFPETNKKEAPLRKNDALSTKPSTSAATKRQQKPKIKKCNVCGDLIVNERLTLREHAIEKHIGKIRIYKCDRCDFDSEHLRGVYSHRSKKHGDQWTELTIRESPLTDDQEKQVAAMIKKCFPDEE